MATWISKESGAEILKSLAIHLASTDLGRKYIISSFIKKNFRTGGNRRGKPFFDYLVLHLVSLLKEKTGDPHYPLILGFLEEQGIVENTNMHIDEIVLRRRFDRATIALDDIHRIMANIQKLRLLKLKLRLISIDKGRKDLPEWFIPLLLETFSLEESCQ
jgi:hypothetical protein